MPNSANRSNKGGSGKGQPKDHPSNDSNQKVNTERSDRKRGIDEQPTRRGDTGRSSNQGRKEASGGSAED